MKKIFGYVTQNYRATIAAIVIIFMFFTQGCFGPNACFNNKVTYGSRVKKYGAVASTTDVVYLSDSLPTGGVIYIIIPSTKDSNRYKDLNYEVKSLDGTIIRKRNAGKVGNQTCGTGYTNTGMSTPSNPNGGIVGKLSGYIECSTIDSVRINNNIGAFELFIMDNSPHAIKIQRYSIIPNDKTK